jgi:hypothetical protein
MPAREREVRIETGKLYRKKHQLTTVMIKKSVKEDMNKLKKEFQFSNANEVIEMLLSEYIDKYGDIQ